MAKINGRYHLICAAFNKRNGASTYDCMSASATSIYGPYGAAYLAVPHGGHNMPFKDAKGQWWSTLFGNDDKATFKERPAILPILVNEAGRIQPK